MQGAVGASAAVRVRVPSKINLFLGVRGQRPDGYHELVTVLQTVSLYDTVTARLEFDGRTAHPAARRFMHLAFTAENGASGALPVDDHNLAVRAARRLMQHCGIDAADGADDDHDGPVTHLHLAKRIPIAAGMAGGSADAAAALVALNALWEAELDTATLRELAADLGADVPFCVGGGTALATGVGTSTAQVLVRGTYYWVVGISDQPLSTPEVYRAYDEVGERLDREPDAVLQALRTGDPDALGAALHNDLQAPAFHLQPALVERRRVMSEAGALGTVVSGSGPTVVGLARDLLDARRIAAEVGGVFDRVEIALSPAGGPELVAR